MTKTDWRSESFHLTKRLHNSLYWSFRSRISLVHEHMHGFNSGPSNHLLRELHMFFHALVSVPSPTHLSLYLVSGDFFMILRLFKDVVFK